MKTGLKFPFVTAALSVIGLLGAHLEARAAVVGMAISIKGAPMVISSKSARRLRLSDRVNSGDKIRCASGSEAVVVLFGNNQRFVIGAGKTGVVGKDGVGGASAQSALSDASGRVAQALSGSKTGAFQGRNVGSGEKAGIVWSHLQDKAPGWMLESDKTFSWAKDINAAQYNFTLTDKNNDVIYSVRATENSFTYPETAPAIALYQPYVWRLTYYRENVDGNLEVFATKWGAMTWVAPAVAQELSGLLANQTPATIGKGDITTALLTAAAFEEKGVLQPALEILDELNARRPTIAGAFDALMNSYGNLPATARAYGPYEMQYAVWKFRTND